MNNRTEQDKRETCAEIFPKHLPLSVEDQCKNLWNTVFWQLMESGKHKPYEAALDASSVVKEYRKQFSND